MQANLDTAQIGNVSARLEQFEMTSVIFAKFQGRMLLALKSRDERVRKTEDRPPAMVWAPIWGTDAAAGSAG